MTKTKTRLISTAIAVVVVAAALFLLMPSVLSTTASGEVWNGQSADSFETGDGTEANPYQINTAEELALMAIKVNSGEAYYLSAHYKLTADIVLNESLDGTPNEWTAIGTQANPFTGKFSGDGHTISGIVINSTSPYQGLFGYLYRNGTIMNVGVVDSSISGGNYVGGVCGQKDGIIKNCYSTGAVSGSSVVGGVCGDNGGTITNCYSTGAVTGTSYNVGGVCGGNYGTIENCYSIGTVNGTCDYVGGVCGVNDGGTIKNCYSTGAVSGTSYVGGVCGYNSGTITNCYSTDIVTGRSDVGGVCGYNYSNGTITNCYYDSDFYTGNAIGDDQGTANNVTGKTTADLCGSTLPTGFDSTVWTAGSYSEVGKKATATLPQLKVFESTSAPKPTILFYNFGTEEAPDWKPYTEISTAEALQNINNNLSGNYVLTANITLEKPSEGESNWTTIGTDDTTPFTGKFSGDGHTISGIVINKSDEKYQGLFGYSTGTIMNVGMIDSSISGYDGVGGVCGLNSGTIENCYSTGAVRGKYHVGGICGWFDDGTITSCYSTAAVSGTDFVGGVCGLSFYVCPIENCYSTGAVSGTDCVGGVCGLNSGNIVNCYSTGAVSGSTKVGGVCGYIDSGTIKNCYSTGAVSGTGDYVGGVGGYFDSGTITNCYYDTDFCTVGGISDQDIEGQATGISTAELCGSTLTTGFETSVWNVGSAGSVTATEGRFGTITYTFPSLNGVGSAATTEEKVYNFGTNGSDNWQPYTEISTAEALQNINNNLGGNYVLTADITLTAPATEGGSNWTAIGNSTARFTGKFSGDGHTISGIVINKSAEDYQGLFGYSTGTIMNVGVINSDITGKNNVGGVCGDSYGYNITIKNCYNTGTVSGTDNVGGICGFNEQGTITNCYYDTDFYTGNAIGDNQETATNVTGISTADLCGSLDDLGFDSAVWTEGSVGDVTEKVGNFGKITYTFPSLNGVGSAFTLEANVYNFGTNGSDDWQIYTEISTADELIALSNDSTKWGGNYVLTANITLTAPAEADGSNWTAIGDGTTPFTGKFSGDGQTISGIVINSTSPYQGLFGYLYRNGTIMNVGVVDSSISGGNYVGGVCGQKDGIIKNCYSTGAVSGSSVVGGICGVNYGGSIENCYSIGAVSGTDNVGGVCGFNDFSTIKNCYSTGEVSGSSYVGGICGDNNLGIIKNCYSTGTVSGTGGRIGGVCGLNDRGSIENCYNIGAVSGSGEKVGGVCGENYGGTIENCYYLEGCSADGTTFTSTEGTSKTETQFKNGSVCYLLNGSTSTNPVWYQLLETENYPNLDSTNCSRGKFQVFRKYVAHP